MKTRPCGPLGLVVVVEEGGKVVVVVEGGGKVVVVEGGKVVVVVVEGKPETSPVLPGPNAPITELIISATDPELCRGGRVWGGWMCTVQHFLRVQHMHAWKHNTCRNTTHACMEIQHMQKQNTPNICTNTPTHILCLLQSSSNHAQAR